MGVPKAAGPFSTCVTFVNVDAAGRKQKVR